MPAHRLVMLGDVVESRDIEDRSTVGPILEETLSTVNDDFEESVRAQFRPLKGIDEFGGVLTGVADLYRIVRTIAFAVHPVQIRFAAVLGEVDVAADSDDVSLMDGPAFHRADQLLDDLAAADLLFRLDASDEPPWSLVDAMAANSVTLHLMLLAGWTGVEVDILRAYESYGAQSAAAESLDVAQQRISNVVRETDWRAFQRMETDLNHVLEAYDERLQTEYAL